MTGSRKINLAVGFDGGGSKTECVVMDAGGNVLGRGMAGPSNPMRAGLEVAFAELAEAAAEALSHAHLKPRQIDAVCAGLAGAARRSVIRSGIVFLSHEFPDALTHVTTDYDVALEAAVGQEVGVVLIAGTGSVAFGRNASGKTARAGGFGRWIGDEGSGYEIGRRAVARVARGRDQGGPPTLLSDLIPSALQCPSWDELMDRIAKNPDEIFPRLFRVVVSAAERGDDAAREILYAAALDLSSLALTVTRQLDLQDETFPLVKCGGVFESTSAMDEVFDPVFASGASRAMISHLQVSAAVGAARLAVRVAAGERPAVSQGADH